MKIKSLVHKTFVYVTIASFVPASTFAEQWTQSGTVERVIGAAGVILSTRNAPRGTRQSVAASILEREIQEMLRRRDRNSQSQRRQPTTSRRERDTGRRDGYSSSLIMPVAGVSRNEIEDSFGDARSGGRSHMGIDIFAPRWTEALAATSGSISSVSTGERSGRSLWLIGNDGRAYFYAHLQDWGRGIRNGTRVNAGDVIGYVGNSGNAASAPPHLHFEVRDGGKIINPYPVLSRAKTV